MNVFRGNHRRVSAASAVLLVNVLFSGTALPCQTTASPPFAPFQGEQLPLRRHVELPTPTVRPDERVVRATPDSQANIAVTLTRSQADTSVPKTLTEPAPSSNIAAATTENSPAVPEIPIPHKPYSVRVTIGFDGSESQDPGFRESCTSDIRQGLGRMFGSMWDTQVAASDWLIPVGDARLRRLKEAEVMARYPDPTTEKVILVSVASANGAFDVSCREYDSRVQELSPVLSEQTYDIQSVPGIACRLIRDCFRPVLLLSGTSIDKSELEFHLQAGCLIPPDPSAAQIAKGDVLRTFIRQMDRRSPGKLKLLQKLDLCYVRVTSFNEPLPAGVISSDDKDLKPEGQTTDSSEAVIDSGHVRGVLISHGFVPFGGRGRSMQQIALRQRPSASRSRVRLVLQSQPDRPLICFRVDKVAKLRYADTSDVPSVRILTDRNGELEINTDPENPTFWLYVYSGSLLLARVPYAPGLVPLDTMKLPDDSLRLSVEGGLYLFRDELVDNVALQAVHMSLAKKAADKGDVAGLEAAIKQLDELPGKEHFERELNSIQTPAVLKADQQKNPGVKRKIESLCRSMSASLATFYATDKRTKEAEELEKLRQSAASKATAVPPLTPPPTKP